jgi:hypothetical protein
MVSDLLPSEATPKYVREFTDDGGMEAAAKEETSISEKDAAALLFPNGIVEFPTGG